MGSEISAVANTITDEAEGDNAEAPTELQTLMSMAKKQEQIFNKKLVTKYEDGIFKEYNPSRLLTSTSFTSASINGATNNNISDGLESIMAELFGISLTDKDKDESYDKDEYSAGLTSMFKIKGSPLLTIHY